MKDLTQKQRAILEYIEASVDERGYPPSLREIAAQFGIIVPTAQQHLAALQSKGFVERSGRGGRALTVIGGEALAPPAPPSRIPLVSAIAAGTPIAVDEMPDSYVDFMPDWFGRGSLAAVSVRGDSMSGDAIADGDVAIIRLQKEARPNEIAAVRVESAEVTLKRVQIHDDLAHLIPSNPAFDVRRVAADQVEIVGVLAGILRRSST